MAAVSISMKSSTMRLPSRTPSKLMKQHTGSLGQTNVSFSINHSGKVKLATSNRSLSVKAGYSDGNNASNFVSGFVLGGLIFGTLSCLYAPQIRKTLAETDKKDLMRKLPKFMYDEEKALKRTSKVLTDKIAQLNAAIDEVSAQLRSEDDVNEGAVKSDEIEAVV